MTLIKKSLRAAVILATISNASLAEQAAIEEVIVTAQKREQSQQDVPIAMTAISADTLSLAAISNFDELQFKVPSLSISTNLSPLDTAIRLRGAGSSGNEPSIEPSVGMFIDQVYQSRSGLGISDLVDVEQIEILYGPQSTLYGKNTNAGVISITTKGPAEELEGFVSYGTGTDGLQDISGTVSGPIAQQWGYRLSGRYRESDGWLDDSSRNTTINNLDEYSLRGKLAFTPTDKLNLLLTISHVKRQPDCCGSEVKYGPDYYAVAQQAGATLGDDDGKNSKVDVNVDTTFELESTASSLHLNYQFNDFTLTSISAWDEYDSERFGDEDRSNLDMILTADSQDGESWSQELRLTSPSGETVEYIVGLFYYYNDLQRGDGSKPRVILGADIDALWPAIQGQVPAFINRDQVAAPGEYSTLNNHWQQHSFAAFGQSQWNIDDRWQLSAGLRYAYEKKDADIRISSVTTTPFSLLRFNLAPDTDEQLDDDDNSVTGMLSLLYQLEAINLYATVASGYKAFGFNGTAGNFTPEERKYDPETSTNYEIGAKSLLLNNRLRLNAAIFYTVFEDFHALTFDGDAGTFFLRNAGEQISKGVEVSGDWAISSYLSTGFDISYLDAEYEDYKDGPCYYNSPIKKPDGGCDLSGETLPFAPDWSGNLYLLFQKDIDWGTYFFRTDWFGTSNQNIDTKLNPAMEESISLFGLSTGIRSERWELTLWGKNITDQTNHMLAAEVPIISDTNQYWLNPPRSWGGSVKLIF
jgi:iron complex outermembrane receptor protein